VSGDCAGYDAFAPVSEHPEGPPPLYEYLWYGTPALWTMINPNGDVGRKRRLVERRLLAHGRTRAGHHRHAEHLDGSASRVEAGPGTNGFHPDLGDFMLVGVEIPDPRC